MASWIGVCPGSEESAGENHSSRSSKGNRFLRRLFYQAAQAAPRTNDSHLQTIFKPLVARLGYVRAIWAIAHRICKIVWRILRKGDRFIEFSQARNPKAIQRAINHHLKLFAGSVTPFLHFRCLPSQREPVHLQERDFEGVGDNTLASLLGYESSGFASSGNGIAQGANAFDLHFYGVARVHLLRQTGRASVNQVTRT